LTWTADGAVAEGHVIAEVEGATVATERAEVHGRLLLIDGGTLVRGADTIVFERGVISLADGAGDFTLVHAEMQGATLDAETIHVAGTWTAEHVTLAPCPCSDGKPPALILSARRAEVTPGSHATLHGGAVRLGEVPVLPVPYWREPLDPRRFRLDLPEIGHGSLGWMGSWSGRWGAGGWRFSGGPAFREDRGFRATTSISGPVDLDAEGGWDWSSSTARGAVRARAGFAQRDHRLTWDLTALSDLDYAADYGPTYIARGVPYRESRALGGWGPARAELWMPDDGSLGRVLDLRARPTLGTPAISISPRLALGLLGGEDPTFQVTPPLPRASAGADAQAGAHVGPLYASASGDAELAATATALSGWAAAEGAVEAPLWSESGTARAQWWPGVRLRAGETWGVPLVPEDTGPWSDFSAGPSLRVESRLGAAWVAGRALLGVTPGGQVLPEGTIDVSGGALALRVSGTPEVQSASVRWEGGFSPWVGGVHEGTAGATWFARAGADARAGRWLVSAWAAAELEGGDLAGVGTTLGYDDGCTAILATATAVPDRAEPDLGLRVQWRK
jgi:hypothetical protein